jgi:glycosyltransferase involved in cell wall biosynthesis
VKAKRELHQFLVSREYGGASEIALQLVRRTQQSTGTSTHVWLPGEGRASERFRGLGLPMHYYDGEGIFSRSALRSGRANLATAARLRRMGRGLIHIHSPHTYAALRHGFRLAGVKRILHIHLDFDREALRWALKTPPELIVTCARFLVDGVREALPTEAQQRQRIEAVPNAVDLERFKPANKLAAKHHVGAPTDRPLVLMMANLAPHKGQETALRAVATLFDRGTEVQLWLAGADRSPDKAFEARLRSLINELGLRDRACLLGFRQDGADLLQAADVVLLPSTSEGLPLTLLEAQACETPVIAAPTAGVPEIVSDGATGFLVAAHDVEGYAAKIDLIIRQPEIAHRIAENAAARCRTSHHWDAYHARIAELYSEVLAS